MWVPNSSCNTTTTNQVNSMPMEPQPPQPPQAYTTHASTTLPVEASPPTPDSGNGNGMATLATPHSAVGTYPTATTTYPNATNTYTNATNSYTNATNTYSNATNTYTNATTMNMNATNTYMNATSTYPNVDSAYPSTNITYPNGNVACAPANHNYPNTNNPSHDNQQNHSDNINVNTGQAPWLGTMSAHGFPTVEMGQYHNFGGCYPTAFNDTTNLIPPTNQQQVIGGNTNMSISHAGNINVATNASAMIPNPMAYYPNGQVNVIWPNNQVSTSLLFWRLNDGYSPAKAQHSANPTLPNTATPGSGVPLISMPQPGGTFTTAPTQVASSQAEEEDNGKGKKKQSAEKRKQVDPNDVRDAFNDYCGYNKGSRAVLAHPPDHPEYIPRFAPGSSEPYLDMHWLHSPRSDANLTVYENVITRMREADQVRKAIEDPNRRRFEKATDDCLKDHLATYFVTRKKQYLTQNKEEKKEDEKKRRSGNRRRNRRRAKAGRRRSAVEQFVEQNGEENSRGIIDLILSEVQSSEYSDNGNDKDGFTVLDLPWRSRETYQVTHLYHELDRLNDQESSIRRASGGGGKGGVSKPRQTDPKKQVCRRPTPHKRPPAACVKPSYQTHNNVKQNDPNWTIVTWMTSNTLEDGYDADGEGEGGTVANESSPTRAPENSGPTGIVSASAENRPADPATTGSMGSHDNATTSADEHAVGVASTPASVNGVGSNSNFSMERGDDSQEQSGGVGQV
ncbi:hypothetical protein K435DRAFT_803688 [Dendrothele bispora CBS 962.96]|uniref:Uncharacterized protein n=1 Tax=Dendrothele bispora (strain CBS 962.96) TaxID=1314807 RepID=A0A4S8LHF3_DENBC|nr:hypothetical protein K435DRAFT_803688 [Dendrothele bispora CBS 962.96]